VGRWILRTTSGAAVIPDTYRLQAGDADDTTSFENYPTFHYSSLERPTGSHNALFGEGTTFIEEKCGLFGAVWLIRAQEASERESWEFSHPAKFRDVGSTVWPERAYRSYPDWRQHESGVF
jgi:hypothetical protein